MRFLISILTLMTFMSHATTPLQKYTLDNGLKIIVKEDHRAPVAISMIWYNIGSADEPGGITGVSHALEHMMFKGTHDYPTGTFSQTIAKRGGQENAMTNYDYTAYFEKIAAVELPIALKLEADRMHNLIFAPDEFNKEIKVIQEERRLRTEDNPQALTLERYLATAHLSEPYQHPIIGWMGDLQEMKLNDVKTWYQHFYAPNNATLVVVGDVSGQQVYDLAKLYFNEIPRQPNYIRKKQVEPPSMGAKRVDINKPAQLPVIMMGYTTPTVTTAKEPWEPYALELAAGILNAGDSSRFAKNLIRGAHVANAAEVYYNLYARYQTQFILIGIPTPNYSTDRLKQIFLQEISRLQRELISDAELDRIKTQIIAQKTFEKDSMFGQAMEIGLLETLGLNAESANHYTDQIKQVTAQQIQAVTQRYFIEKNMTEARLTPSK